MEIRYATVPELGRALRRREIGALELARYTLEALARVGPAYNALANLTAERALEEARRAERLLATGDATSLCGIPYGAKDLFAARGAATTWGTPRYRDRTFDEDATVVARLARRGGVLAAKLATVELAGGGRPSRPGASIHGRARNPWDLTRYSGGSSSGPAVAVALGLIPYALGTETAGSIMSPATFSGVTGLRPTYGLIPRTGTMPLSWTLDKVGLLARTAADIATVLAHVAGPDRRDRTSAGRFRPFDRRAARAAVRRARIGYAGNDVAECEPHVRTALAGGLAELRRIAPRWTRAEFRADLPYTAILMTIMLAEAATAHAEMLEDPAVDVADRKQLAELRTGLHIRARDYLQALRLVSVLRDDVRRVFREVDVLVSPSRPHTAVPLDGPPRTRTGGSVAERLSFIGNLAGLVGIALPCGIAADGLPVAIQIVGPPRSEPLVLAIAEEFQRLTDFHHLRPPDAAAAL